LIRFIFLVKIKTAASIFGGTYSHAPPIVDKRKPKKKSSNSKPNTPSPEPQTPEPAGAWSKEPEKPKSDVQFVMPEAYQMPVTHKKSKKRNKKRIEETEESYLLPGRQMCDCQAQKHRLINNCLSCGRIVC